LRKKVTLPRDLLPKVIATYAPGLEPVIERNPLYQPIQSMPASFSDSDKTRLTQEFRQLIETRVLPGFRKFDEFFRTEYARGCRKGYGMSSLPQGKKWYRHRIRAAIGLNLTPSEIHARGLEEVRKLREEVTQVKEALGMEGSLEEFFRSVTKDPRFLFKDIPSMMAAFHAVKEKLLPILPRYFDLAPKSDYDIVEYNFPGYNGAAYFPPKPGIPKGKFGIPTNKTTNVPVHIVTSLSLHEGAPGHHYQYSLDYELTDQQPEFQRSYYSDSFAEGWAHYSEYLGSEMGLYEDPMQKLGTLTMGLVHASILVVDTGIHDLGWTRAEAMDYLARNTTLSQERIEGEVDRYANNPGQALSYKLGQLKILELRKRAESALGNQFDLRKFHNVVIGNGHVSLRVLEQLVNEWIGSEKKAGDA
jgi:uncharacterized protein (DUF885 family)